MSNRVPSPPLNYDYSVVTADTDHAATLLLDAKNEYNKQLVNLLRQPIFKLMNSIYNTADNICHQENTPENVLMVFQDNLALIPKWNKQRRTKEYTEFLKTSNCEWFNELIKFTYVTHVKILTIVNKSRKGIKLSISIPSGATFFHSVCVTVARELWKSPFLFSPHVGGKYEYQKNMRQIEQIIDNSVDVCIREHIPMKAILQDYLDSDLTVTPIDNINNLPIDNQKNDDTINTKETETNPETKSEELLDESIETKNLQVPESKNDKKPNKLLIQNDLDDFLDEEKKEDLDEQNISKSLTPTSDTQIKLDESIATSNESIATSKEIENLEDIDLNPVNLNEPEEIEEELDIIETNINSKDLPIDVSTDMELDEISLDKQNNRDLEQQLQEPQIEPQPEPQIEPQIEPQLEKVKQEEKQKENIINEFDIDSLPDININNDTLKTKETPLESSLDKQNETTPTIDINEPGIEFKKTAVKKIIPEPLLDDDLEEVSLENKLNMSKEFINNTRQQQQPKTFSFF